MPTTTPRQWQASDVRTAGWCRRRSGCVLRALPVGDWEIMRSGQSSQAHLLQAWSTWGWITLRFAVSGQHTSSPDLRFTVWRHKASAAAWRELRVIAARQLAMPDRAIRTEQP